jgi:murein DD-endopeptidase MepM/ murein hydrolase activator NlpD
VANARAADYQSMSCARTAAVSALAMLLAALCGAVAPALALAVRPTVAALSVPRTSTAGRPPRVALRIDERGVASVYVRLTLSSTSTRKAVVVASLGWVRTDRTIVVAWPASATLPAGAYELSVSAHDRRGAVLAPGARSSNDASLTVTAPAPPPTLPPAVSAPQDSQPVAPAEAGVPTIAETVADGAVFPVAGPHNFGGPENIFGAPRDGYLHQGQDVLSTEGTPVVAPLAGTILTTSYQEGGAGYYAVEQTGIGFDFMFAHCEAASLAVSTGQSVTAGQLLCKAGQTGDATAPHLDFEMWVGGWQAVGGRPINPLPYLEAWEH